MMTPNTSSAINPQKIIFVWSIMIFSFKDIKVNIIKIEVDPRTMSIIINVPKAIFINHTELIL
jgi:hypothetical protein